MPRKVFISYAHDDDNKRKMLYRRILKAEAGLDPVVIVNRQFPGKPLADKVAEGIQECEFFVPILTKAALKNQWVNQEIGYAFALKKPIVPIVASSILHHLKGFIHAQNDLPFIFQTIRSRPQAEARRFKASCDLLINYLKEPTERTFETSISPIRLKAGADYSTTVRFRGNVSNGFFDNHAVHLDSSFHRWNWDPNTIVKHPGMDLNTSPGLLDGDVNTSSNYTHSTQGWPIGRYKIHVGLYSHIQAGKRGRQLVAENTHDLEIY